MGDLDPGAPDRVVTNSGNYCLPLCFLLRAPVLLLWHLPPLQQPTTKRAISMLMKPLADHSGLIVEEGGT